MKRILVTHWAGIVLALLAGLTLVFPQLLFMRSPTYQGIDLMGSDAETHYLARMHELYDGNYAGNPFLAEFKNQDDSPFLTPVELVAAVPGKLLYISIPTLNIIYKFLLPVVIFLLVYGLLWRLTAERLIAVSGATLVVLGYNVVTLPGLTNLLHWHQVYHQFGLYARPINPEISGILFFLFLHLLYSLWVQPKRWHVVTAGVILGVSFYVYFYLWTFLAMLCGVFFLVGIARKVNPFPILFITLLGFILGAPALVFTFHLIQNPLYAGLAPLLGVVYGHMPEVSTLGLGVVVVLAFMAFKKMKLGQSVFAWVLMGAAFVSMLQSVITGINIQGGHYHWYFSVPIFSLVTVMIVGEILGSYRWLKSGVLGAIIVISFLNAYLVQISSYTYWRPKFIDIQRARPALQWLDEHAPNNSVVLADEFLSELVPIYTHNNVFWNPYALYYLLPSQRLEQTAFVTMRLYGITQDQAAELIAGTISSRTPVAVSQFFTSFVRPLYAAGFLERYRIFSRADTVAALRRFNVAYLIRDRATGSPACPDGLTCSVVFSGPAFDILKFP